jgi:predicted membrane chloride channel (bestrophin family)
MRRRRPQLNVTPRSSIFFSLHLIWRARTRTLFHVTKLFRGNPRLLFQAIPVALVVIVLKWLYDASALPHLELNPLLTGVVAAEVFLIGFMLSGTAGDFKEAERLPGELAASLETVADECLIVDAELELPEAAQCVKQLITIAESVRAWLLSNDGLDTVMANLRALNPLFIVFAPAIQAGFTSRLKSEQATMRRLIIRMDTMRRTSFVSAGYLIAEVTALAVLILLLMTNLGQLAPTILVVGVISYLLFYLLALIRDLDNPFEYLNGKPGAADVHLDVLEVSEDRLRAFLVTMSPIRP